MALPPRHGLRSDRVSAIAGDSGPGAVLGPFEGQVAAIGPNLAYNFTVGGHHVATIFRWLRGFWREHPGQETMRPSRRWRFRSRGARERHAAPPSSPAGPFPVPSSLVKEGIGQ